MPSEVRDALRRGAAVPSYPLDLEPLLARGYRHRRRRRMGAVAGSFLLVAVAAGMVLDLPQETHPPAIRLDELPDGWSELVAPPEARMYAATVWTGDRLLIWGGGEPSYSPAAEATGLVFDTGTGGWHAMAPAPVAARLRPASAWTGQELLVWGGIAAEQGGERFQDGAAYDPAADTWRTLPAAPVGGRAPLSVWTGQELVVWGTAERRTDIPTDGAAYNPHTDTWRRIADGHIELTDATAVWTGTEMIVLGAALDGDNLAATETAIGAAYDPQTDTWRRLPDSGLSPQASTAAWTGAELIAADYLGGAAAYHPVTDTWRSLPDVPVPPGECGPTSVAAAGRLVGDFCRGLVAYDDEHGWRELSDPGYTPWWRELIPADPVILLLGGDILDDRTVMFGYRPTS